jgi:hypothetical protein
MKILALATPSPMDVFQHSLAKLFESSLLSHKEEEIDITKKI